MRPPWTTEGPFPVKLTTHVPWGAATLLPGTDLRERKIFILTKARAQMFTQALLLMSKGWQQPPHPTGEQANATCGFTRGILHRQEQLAAALESRL